MIASSAQTSSQKNAPTWQPGGLLISSELLSEMSFQKKWMFSSMGLIIHTALVKIVFLLFKKQTQQSVITNLSGKTTEKHPAHDYQNTQPHKTVLLKVVALQHS